MALQAPPLPTRFPCWCKAVFSWGGETKRDLGFIEGDLIECLNAGDGSWWMGRLKRDKRMVGLFPSNFVEVLDESFQPTSPLPPRSGDGGSLSRASSPMPETVKVKNKSVFRKPFQAYTAAGSPNPEAARRDSQRGSGSNDLASQQGSMKNHKPFSTMKQLSRDQSATGSVRAGHQSPFVPSRQNSKLSSFRAVSPAPPRPYPRAASPNPHGQGAYLSRASSPNSNTHADPYARAASPNDYFQNNSHSRAASPMPAAFTDPDFHMRAPSPAAFPEIGSSPPPPPPPPHRIAYQPSRAPSPQDYDAESQSQLSPAPPSPAPRSYCTPSPLTRAMNGVMDSLEDMGARDMEASSPEPPKDLSHEIFSPDSFDLVYAASVKKSAPAALNQSMKHQDSGYGSVGGTDDDSGGAIPQLGNYVQRMESRLRQMHLEEEVIQATSGPPPPLKDFLGNNQNRQNVLVQDSIDLKRSTSKASHRLRSRKSAYELGRAALNRTFTHKSSSTNTTDASSSTQHSLMSGASAGAFSATSAGSLARRTLDLRANDANDADERVNTRPISAMNWPSKNASVLSLGTSSDLRAIRGGAASAAGFRNATFHDQETSNGLLGGLTTPVPKKRGFLQKLVDSAKTGAASARSTISSSGDMSGRRSQAGRPHSRAQSAMERPRSRFGGITGISGGLGAGNDAAREMGLGGDAEWVQVRRDVNRSNTISRNERSERNERAQMQDLPALAPIDILSQEIEGDEGLDGLPITDPTDFVSGVNLALVDKSTRFVTNLPLGINVATLAQSYICRPYRGDVQRLRAIFTWVSERVSWEEEFEADHGSIVDTRRVIQSKRGTSKEIAHLVAEMCVAVGLGAEVVHGYLKAPGEGLVECMEHANYMKPNHWWNTVIVDGEWRVMDTALANPTNPKRGLYSACPSSQADGYYFLTRPVDACFTHVPDMEEFQHILPPMNKRVLLALPAACPPYFKHDLQLIQYDTSILFIDSLEMVQVQVESPEDVECVAELEVREFIKDSDGDCFESGEVVGTPALCQAEWYGGKKRWTIKTVLPGDEGRGVLKIYGGKRGLMHSIKSNPHPLALALPIVHSGSNPPYSFLTRHPTPHAQRHDLYVAQPQCGRLAIHNTFVFTIRQHPSSQSGTPSIGPGGFSISRPASALGASIPRPHSAMSMNSVSVAGSAFTNTSGVSNPSSNASSAGGSTVPKPAKLAIQSPSGKILRVTRKNDTMTGSGREVEGDGSTWETVIKVGEKGTWRGLVLADRSARWCVFGEWECY